jgi:hypothetical protein
MSKSRVSVFGGSEEDGDIATLDVTSFAPKAQPDQHAPPAEKVRAVSEAAKFPSREPSAMKPEPKTKAAKREPRRHRTGRNVQVSIKALAESVDRFYAITDAHPGWVLGYTFQRAIEALERELKQSK